MCAAPVSLVQSFSGGPSRHVFPGPGSVWQARVPALDPGKARHCATERRARHGPDRRRGHRGNGSSREDRQGGSPALRRAQRGRGKSSSGCWSRARQNQASEWARSPPRSSSNRRTLHDNSQATHKQPLARTGTPRRARAGGHHSMISGTREGGSLCLEAGPRRTQRCRPSRQCL